MKNENNFRIYNDTWIVFDFMDRIRILFGKKVTVSVTICTDVYIKKTENSYGRLRMCSPVADAINDAPSPNL